jgi:homoserine kinase
MPVGRGLGSSAAAIVAGLLAANEFGGLGLDRFEIYRRAFAIEGHGDNVAAALYGGVVIAPSGTGRFSDEREPVSLEMPPGLVPVVAIPACRLNTQEARNVLPNEVPMRDAVANVCAAARLVAGICRADRDLIADSLGDRLHQPYRSHLYESSVRLLGEARHLGALGATISGAGPSVLLWCDARDAPVVAEAVQARPEWERVICTSFCSPMTASLN